MAARDRLRIGITCYPTVGGSGILASALGVELARRGHEVHLISYERPVRVPARAPRVFFHPVSVSDYDLFKYPDYTLPLSVKMAEVSRDHGLDLLHVHYAVPHATAAVLATSMLPAGKRPKIVTTLHGTDATLLGKDPGYGPAIRHALECSDGVTAVSEFLRAQTREVLGFTRPLEVIPNFFEPRAAPRPRGEVRAELGIGKEAMILHLSNLRPVKRIDLLLRTVARIRPRDSFRLVILAGGDFSPYAALVRRLGIGDRVVVLGSVSSVEDYLHAADFALFTSESESFCLGILEAMCFGRPSVSTSVGGIPEVVEPGITGILAPFGNTGALARAAESLIRDPAQREAMGRAARKRARMHFSADVIVPRYEAFYRRICSEGTAGKRERTSSRQQ